MMELARHIEVLLLESDCVIVPGLGGFVAYHTPARRSDEENLFLPPSRTIGFNPLLKLNDGVLVQSYMAVYGTDFSDATRMVEKQVGQLIEQLHADGKVDLPNVGELAYTLQGTYRFHPYDDRITTPTFYGLGSFEMHELPVQPKSCPALPEASRRPAAPRRRSGMRLRRSVLSNVLAILLVLLMFAGLSIPVENTDVVRENYALLLPDDLLARVGEKSLAVTPVMVVGRNLQVLQAVKDSLSPNARQKSVPDSQQVARPVAVREVMAEEAASTPRYHIIVASVGTKEDAQNMVARLVGQGFSEAQTLIGGGKIRVSIRSFATKEEADQTLPQVRKMEAYQSAWILKQ